MSRRLQTAEVQRLLSGVEQRLAARDGGGWVLLVDGKPLTVGPYSKDPEAAARLVLSLRGGGGYLLGDKAYDSNPLHDAALAVGCQLVAERKRPKAGLGHCRHSPGRLRSIELLCQEFGQQLYAFREQVERNFGWLTNHAAGLAPLPNWVRRIHRVRAWVQAKLIIHAAYVYLDSMSSSLAAE